MKKFPLIIVMPILFVVFLFARYRIHSDAPKATEQTVERIGMYDLPKGTYTLLSIADEGFAAPDHKTKQYVYRLKNVDSGKMVDAMLICGPENLAPIGKPIKAISPGVIETVDP